MGETHTPAAMRKIGFVATKNYAIGGIFAALYIWLISLWIWNKNNFSKYLEIDDLLRYQGQGLRTALIFGVLITFILWLLLGSKISICRMHFFRNFFRLCCLLAFSYIVVLAYYEMGRSFTQFDKVPLGIVIFGYILLFVAFIIVPFDRDIFKNLFHPKNYRKLFKQLNKDEFLNLIDPVTYEKAFEMPPFVKKTEAQETFFDRFFSVYVVIVRIYTFIAFLYCLFSYSDRYLWSLFWMILPPFLAFMLPNMYVVAKEYVKEYPLYRDWFILGKREESARWASFYGFFQRDISGFFARNRKKIWWSKKSIIYYGETHFKNDVQLCGRKIGSQSELHHMTFAGTGGGKSRDAIWNTLLSYAGGVVCFDPKGEHTVVTRKRRSRNFHRPFYALDPYDLTSKATGYATNYWNPMDEINVDNPSARDQLRNMVAASLFIESSESGNTAHFRENAQLILRGYIAHVLTDFSIPKEKKHLGTVYDLLKTGGIDGARWSKAAMDKLLENMLLNNAIANAPRDAASLLVSVTEKEASAYLSTISRGIDWINSPPIRNIITKGHSDFSVREAKSKEATIYLVMDEDYIDVQRRFISTFYSMALDFCGNSITPQPKGSKRRTLFLFDEFAKLGHFEPVKRKITFARSSYIKLWLIFQNYGQLKEHYKSAGDFTGSSDMQFFAIKSGDDETIEYIHKALGNYSEKDNQGQK